MGQIELCDWLHLAQESKLVHPWISIWLLAFLWLDVSIANKYVIHVLKFVLLTLNAFFFLRLHLTPSEDKFLLTIHGQ